MKQTKKLLAAMMFGLVMLFMVSIGTDITAQAAVKTKYEKIDRSKTFKGSASTIKVKNYYKYVQLEGDTAAIKAINSSIKKYAKAAMKNPSGLLDYVEDDVEYREYDDIYYDCYSQKVTYQSKDVISISTTYTWYAGGVSNTGLYGCVYDLNTGKEIKKITALTKETSIVKLRKTIVKKALASDSNLTREEVESVVNQKKATDFDFYLNKNGNVVVTFGPYELGYGGWFRSFTLAAK